MMVTDIGDKFYITLSPTSLYEMKKISSVISLFGEFAALDTKESILWTVTFVVDTTETCCGIVFWTFTVDTI